MMSVMDIVTYMMHVAIYMMSVMDIVIYMSCLCFLEIFGREKQKKKQKNWVNLPCAVRQAHGKLTQKYLPQQEICCAPGAAHGKLTILCRAPRH
jgi:hypothetical protein